MASHTPSGSAPFPLFEFIQQCPIRWFAYVRQVMHSVMQCVVSRSRRRTQPV